MIFSLWKELFTKYTCTITDMEGDMKVHVCAGAQNLSFYDNWGEAPLVQDSRKFVCLSVCLRWSNYY